jgi:hypothetical protein
VSGKVTGLVWDLDLPQNEKYVLLAYADKADHEGHNCYPGVGLVAWMTGYSEDSVRRLTRDLLHKRNLLEVEERGGGGRANKFRVCLENFKNFERAPRKRRGRPSNDDNPPQNKGGLNGEKTPITAMPPQRPFTTSSLTPTGQAAPASARKNDGHTPEPNDYYIAQLYNDLEARELLDVANGGPMTPDYKAKLAGHLSAYKKRGARHGRILLALDRIKTEWARRKLTFSEAWDDTLENRNNVTPLRPVEPARPKKRVIS